MRTVHIEGSLGWGPNRLGVIGQGHSCADRNDHSGSSIRSISRARGSGPRIS